MSSWPIFLRADHSCLLVLIYCHTSVVVGVVVNAVVVVAAVVSQFHEYMLLLVVVSAVTGVATGVRGSTFIILGARFSTRLRQVHVHIHVPQTGSSHTNGD